MYKFIYQEQAPSILPRTDIEITHHDSSPSISDLLEVMEYFLKACGYNFKNQHLELVEDASMLIDD